MSIPNQESKVSIFSAKKPLYLKVKRLPIFPVIESKKKKVRYFGHFFIASAPQKSINPEPMIRNKNNQFHHP
jgi:hypothetical protein